MLKSQDISSLTLIPACLPHISPISAWFYSLDCCHKKSIFTGLKIIRQTNIILNMRIILILGCSLWSLKSMDPSEKSWVSSLDLLFQPLMQMPSVAACLWVVLHSVLSSVSYKHSQFRCGQDSDLAIWGKFYVFGLTSSWIAFTICFSTVIIICSVKCHAISCM